MAELTTNNQLGLSAEELRSMTKWPDALIEDYLAISGNVVQITQEILVVIEQTSVTVSVLDALAAKVSMLMKKLNSVEELASGGDTKISVKFRQHHRSLTSHLELIAGSLSDVAKERSSRVSFQRKIPALMMARVVIGI